MRCSVLFVVLFCQLVSAQYDDLSVLEEVLARTSQRPIVRQLPSEGTTTPKETSVPSVQTILPSSEAPSSSSAAPSTEQTVSTSTAAELLRETTQEPSTREEVSSPPTTLLPVTAEATTFPLEESTDENDMLFMGMKRPDLATIYRRLFPF